MVESQSLFAEWMNTWMNVFESLNHVATLLDYKVAGVTRVPRFLLLPVSAALLPIFLQKTSSEDRSHSETTVLFLNGNPRVPASFHILLRKLMTGYCSQEEVWGVEDACRVQARAGTRPEGASASNSIPSPVPLLLSLKSFSWENLILGSGSLSGRIQLKKINRWAFVAEARACLSHLSRVTASLSHTSRDITRSKNTENPSDATWYHLLSLSLLE